MKPARSGTIPLQRDPQRAGTGGTADSQFHQQYWIEHFPAQPYNIAALRIRRQSHQIHGNHTLKFGAYELLRGNHTESHTFMPGRFVFGSLPGFLVSPQLASTTINPLQSATLGLPQVYQQGFGDPTYPYYARPLTAFYAQDSWKVIPSLTLNYGLRYDLDTQFAPLSTYKKDFGPRFSFAWDPFKNHKTVIRGGYGIFYGPVDVQIPDVDYSLGVRNANNSSVGNSVAGNQAANVTAICGVSQFGVQIIPGSGGSPCNREISIYADPIGGVSALGIKGAATIFQTLFANGAPGNLIGCTTRDRQEIGLASRRLQWLR